MKITIPKLAREINRKFGRKEARLMYLVRSKSSNRALRTTFGELAIGLLCAFLTESTANSCCRVPPSRPGCKDRRVTVSNRFKLTQAISGLQEQIEESVAAWPWSYREHSKEIRNSWRRRQAVYMYYSTSGLAGDSLQSLTRFHRNLKSELTMIPVRD